MGRVIVWLGDVSREATDETATGVADQLKKDYPELASFGEASIRRFPKPPSRAWGVPLGKGYEAAPATEMVATQCCVCGRPLLEAESLKSGIGPVCAERTGYGREGLSAEVRGEVNRIVYKLALLQKSPEAVTLLGRLRELGSEQIADRIEERLVSSAEIEIRKDTQGRLLLALPKLDDRTFKQVLADLRNVPRRSFLPAEKVHAIPDASPSKRALWEVLQRHFPGRLLKSPKGLVLIPAQAKSAA